MLKLVFLGFIGHALGATYIDIYGSMTGIWYTADSGYSGPHPFPNNIVPGAQLTRTDLNYADLRGADLRGAHLEYANLYDTDLRGANLRGAEWGNPRDVWCNVDGQRWEENGGADLRGAKLTTLCGAGTSFDIDTSSCIVETCQIEHCSLDQLRVGYQEKEGCTTE